MSKKVHIFDTTLRDGAQAEGISFSVEDKIKIVKTLDSLGIAYIEAGNPGSNPKDKEFFERVRQIKLEHSKLVAFGSTRRKDLSVEEDANAGSLLSANTQSVAIFGKCWELHVKEVIKATLDENLSMIYDTIKYFKDNAKEVLFDGEHFFDGYKTNRDYALQTLETAAKAGADWLILCDTNGGCMPREIFDITKDVVDIFKEKNVSVGIHCHDDCGMAVANSIMAVDAGVTQVQGTFVGFGERCGNTNLSAVIPNLQLKNGIKCINEDQMQNLTAAAILISDVANISVLDRAPYVGKTAFAHKGGMHVDGVSKVSYSFEHIPPEAVGNTRRILTSEVTGRSAILKKIQQIEPSVTKESPETEQIMKKLKQMEHDGYQFEAAESSFELLIRKQLGRYKPLFELIHFKTINGEPNAFPNGKTMETGCSASAIIKIKVDGKPEITAAEGDGPVNALDKALRKALEVFYPSLAELHLVDYKVRVLDGKEATAAKVRVLIESADGEASWTTVGVSSDIIQASWIALVDSVEYKLIKDQIKQGVLA